MLKAELLRDRAILIVSPEGPLSADDFRNVAALVDPWIADNGRLQGLLVLAPSFPGWDGFGALVEHMKFVRNHHHNIKRMAAVTDSDFLRIGPAIAQHFVEPEIRVFGGKEQARALAWLETE